MKRSRLSALLWAALAGAFLPLFGCGGNGPPALPARAGTVNDLAGLLPQGDASSLAGRLEAYEKETCHRIVVLIVPSLQGETLAELSARAMETWQIGRGPLGNGLLLTLTVKEGSARIDAGPGLEEMVRSGFAESVLRREMFPRFAEGNFSAGLDGGLGTLMNEGRRFGVPEELRPSSCR